MEDAGRKETKFEESKQNKNTKTKTKTADKEASRQTFSSIKHRCWGGGGYKSFQEQECPRSSKYLIEEVSGLFAWQFTV